MEPRWAIRSGQLQPNRPWFGVSSCRRVRTVWGAKSSSPNYEGKKKERKKLEVDTPVSRNESCWLGASVVVSRNLSISPSTTPAGPRGGLRFMKVLACVLEPCTL